MTALTDQNRIDIVRYRIENANQTLAEVETHNISQTLETVENLLPTAQVFVKTVEQMVNDWLTRQS